MRINNRLRITKLLTKAAKLEIKKRQASDQVHEITLQVFNLTSKIIQEEQLFKGTEWNLEVKSNGAFVLEYEPSANDLAVIDSILEILSIKRNKNGDLIETLFEIFPKVMLEVGSNYIQLNFTDNQMSNRNAIDIINSFGITINTGSLKEDIHKEQRKTNTLQKILHVFGPKATS